MSMSILKVRLHKTKKGNGLVLTFKRSNGTDEVEGTETHKGIIHKDLQAAVDNLAIHLAIMTGYVNGNEIGGVYDPDPDLTDTFHVHGYSIGGDDDNQGIVISGHHILTNGLAVILNTPFSRFEQNPESRYVYMDDLQAKVSVIEGEIAEYLEGKRGTEVQQELNFGDPVPEDTIIVEVTGNGQKKRGRKKKVNAD